MDLKVAARVVSFVTARETTIELVDVLMGLLVVAQDPQLSVRVCAAGVAAAELVDGVLTMCRQMILQMLWHFERFIATLKRTFVEAHLQVRLEVLLLFRILGEHLAAGVH